VFKRNVMVLCLTGVCRNEYFTSFNGFKNRAKFVNFTNFETLGHGFSIYDGGGTPVLWR